jgi:hypothetical protein
MSPWFRDRNYARIIQLDNAGYSPQTIAGIINDESESQVKYTASDIRGYLKVQADASKRMLISKRNLQAVMEVAPNEFEPA